MQPLGCRIEGDGVMAAHAATLVSGVALLCPNVHVTAPGLLRICVFFAGEAAECRSDSVAVTVLYPTIVRVRPASRFIGDVSPVNVSVRNFLPDDRVRCSFSHNLSTDDLGADSATTTPTLVRHQFVLCPVPMVSGSLFWIIRLAYTGSGYTETYGTLELMLPEVCAMWLLSPPPPALCPLPCRTLLSGNPRPPYVPSNT